MMITNSTASTIFQKFQCRFFTTLLLLIMAGFSQFAMAQVDTAFWFAVPQVGVHGNQNSELVISNMSKTTAAIVKISNPALTTNNRIGGAAGFITRNIPIGGSVRIDLNQFYGRRMNPGEANGSLYNIDANIVVDNGLLIQSNTEITAFYELGRDVSGFPQGNNIEIFSLKGGNALGTAFMLPFQNQYETWNSQLSYSSANIVATQNGTIVTITPTQDAIGHPAGIPFNITLNRGQTYSLRAVGLEANRHLSGTSVTSNKPIAISLVDDSLAADFGGGIDMVGDQLVPLNVIGKEYIVARGNAGSIVNGGGDQNRIFILTTQPNTNITISENNVVNRSYLSQGAGVTINYPQPTLAPASYIKSDKPIYVFYVSGSDSELGGALIPPLVCTGSDAVNIVRSTDQELYLIIMAKNKVLNGFTFKKGGSPTPTLINPGDFKQISAGPEGFSIYNKRFAAGDVSQIPVLTPISIENSAGVFHAGISVTGSASGSFGYFSDFNSINISYASKPVCFGDSLILDAGPDRTSYKWYTKTNNVEDVPALATVQKYKVDKPGKRKIYLRIEKKGCPLEDSVEVYVQPKVNLTILKKKIACDNQPVSMDATPAVTSPPLVITKYVWYSATRTIPDLGVDTFARTQNVSVKFPISLGTPAVPIPHKIIVKVTDDKGCVTSDTVEVIIRANPAAIVGTFAPASVCSGNTVQLGQTTTSNKLIYKWMENSTTTPPFVKQPATGLNSLIVSNPNATRQNVTTPPALPAAILHKYYIETTDTATSCIKWDSLILTVNPIPKAQIDLTKSKFCNSDPVEVLKGSAPNYTGGTYNFFVNGAPATQFDPKTASTTSTSKIKLKYVSSAPASCPALDVDSTVTVTEKPTVTMANDNYCSGKSVTIGVADDVNFKYAWTPTTDITTPTSSKAEISVKNTTPQTALAPITKTYTLTVTSITNTTCTNSGTVDVTINPQPMAVIAGANTLNGYCISSTPLTADFVGSPNGNPSAGKFSSAEGGMIGARFTPKTVGDNFVKYAVETFGCKDSTIIKIVVHPLPKPIINGIYKSTFCLGEPINIKGNASSPSTGGFGIPYVPAGDGNFPSTTAGTYKFRYGITTDKGCTDSTSETLTIKALPIVTVNNPGSICVGEQATLTAGGGDTYYWENLTATTASVVVKPIVNSNYKVYAVRSDNCKSVPKTIALTVSNTPIADFPESTINHCFENGTIKISAGLAPNYLWSDGSATDSIVVTQPGNFKVTLSDGNCKTSDEVMVIAACPPRIFLPKAFSPNNDGYNDSLQVFGDHIKDLKLRIFNRWGEVIFETTKKDKMWDGTYNGLPMPQGVYPWALVYKSELVADKNKEFALDGSVSIIQ